METEKQKNDNRELILDGQKIAWHKDRVDAWLRGERIAPLTVDCALTRACNMNCIYCYGQLQENESKVLTKDIIFRFLDDLADIGVKGVSFMSDGESQCSPHIYDAITRAKQNNLDIGFATNGGVLKKEKFAEILPHLTWLRYNISAGEPKRYAEIHGCSEEVLDTVKERISESVQVKKEGGLEVTIGMQQVLLPKFKDQIMPLANLGKELGVDYLVIKHCSDDEDGTLGVKYDDYFDKDLQEEIKKAEALSTSEYLVKAKWSKILSHGEREYTQCYGPPFIIQLSGSGLVAPCGMFFNEKYSEYHMGNIADTSFKEIWQSDRYWEVMDRIGSKDFNAKTDCGCLCLQHKVNEYLWDLKQQGVTEIPKLSGKQPQHINFI